MKLYLLLILTVCGLSPAYAQSASRSRLVGNVTDKTVLGGCGCYFRFRGQRDSGEYMFFEGIEKQAGAWMNIDGRDVQLTVVNDWGSRERERVGRRSRRNFAAQNISVKSTYVVTRVCAAADEDCESHDYAATFLVRKGKRVQTVKAVGVCGC